MFSIIIPCISKRHALKTVESCRKVLNNPKEEPQFIVVIDGGNKVGTEESNGVLFRYLKGINGSYAARNEGVRFAKYNQLLFLDSDVEVLELPDIEVAKAENTLIGPLVCFDRDPEDGAERWYYQNAFKQAEFIRKYQFLPTISLFVSRKLFDSLNGFDERFVSGGDVDFGHRATAAGFGLTLDERFKVRTKLRNAQQIVKKIERQSYGQVFEMLNSEQPWRWIVLLRIGKNSLLWIQSLLFGMKRSGDFSVSHIYACRCRALTASLFLTKDRITGRATLANSREVAYERQT